MPTTPTSYTDADYEALYEYYATEGVVDLEKLNQDIANYNSDYNSTFTAGDLLSFYITQSGGELPPCLTSVDTLADPNSLDNLWNDEDFIEVVQDWRTLNEGDASLSQLVSDIETFLTNAQRYGDLQSDLYQFSMTLDAQDVIEDFDAANPGVLDNSDSAESSDSSILKWDTSTLMTDAQTIAMMLGMGPGMAILFYLMGSKMKEEVPTSVEDLPDYMEDNGDGTVTIHTQNGDITASLGETVYFETGGFARNIEDLNETILDKYEDNMDDIDDVIGDMEDLDPEDSEYQADFKRLEEELSALKNGNEILTNCFEISFDIFESMVEAASAIIDRQSRTWGSIVNRM